MSTQPRKVTAKFYAQVKPKFGTRYDSTLRRSVRMVTDITVVAITQKPPARPQSGVVVVTLELRFNEAAFLPLAPAAIIDIPDSMVAAGSVLEVEATDENGAAVAAYLAEQARGANGANP